MYFGKMFIMSFMSIYIESQVARPQTMMRIIFPTSHDDHHDRMLNEELSDDIISKIQKMDANAKKIFNTLPESKKQTYEKYTSSFFE